MDLTITDYILCAIPIVGTFISIVIWGIFGRDKIVKRTISKYPPEGNNSLEFALILRGSVNGKDVTSLLLSLAQDGYISISNARNGSDVKIVKQKEYHGSKLSESTFFYGLFQNKDSVLLRNVSDGFYQTVDKVQESVEAPASDSIIIHNYGFMYVVFAAIIIATLVMTIPPLIMSKTPFFLCLFAIVFTCIGYYMLAYVFISEEVGPVYSDSGKVTTSRKSQIMFGLVWFLGTNSIVFFAILYDGLQMRSIFMVRYFIGAASILVMTFFANRMSVRTKRGSLLLSKAAGLKKFIVDAKREELEELTRQDPTYIYKILPYAYTLGMAKKWLNKFKGIRIEKPDWCRNFNWPEISDFANFIESFMKDAEDVMCTRPATSIPKIKNY